MEMGISAGMRISNFFRRAATAIMSAAGEVKTAAQKLIVNTKDEARDVAKMNRRYRRAYRSLFRHQQRSSGYPSKLARKAAFHKLCGRTSRLIQRYERLEMKRRLAYMQRRVAAGYSV